jgi:hypothetical protein
LIRATITSAAFWIDPFPLGTAVNFMNSGYVRLAKTSLDGHRIKHRIKPGHRAAIDEYLARIYPGKHLSPDQIEAAVLQYGRNHPGAISSPAELRDAEKLAAAEKNKIVYAAKITPLILGRMTPSEKLAFINSGRKSLPNWLRLITEDEKKTRELNEPPQSWAEYQSLSVDAQMKWYELGKQLRSQETSAQQ